MKTVVTAGEILVEIMATRIGQTFLEPGPLVGPSPPAHQRSSSIRSAGSASPAA